MKQFGFLLLFLFSLTNGLAQDKVTLISGAVLDGKVVQVSDSLVNYEQQKKGRTKTRELDAYRVFSVEYADGREVIVYEQDTALGNYFSKDEMRLFIMGEQDASENYKGSKAFLVGLGLGIAGGLAIPESFLVVGVPVGSTLLAMAPRIKIKPELARDRKLLSEPAYLLGFERTARNKKIQNILKGSVLGTILSVVGYSIVNNNN